jgi:hypothetical protein
MTCDCDCHDPDKTVKACCKEDDNSPKPDGLTNSSD